jgi:MscS family membrane protein
VMAWFETADWSEFQLIRQEVLLRFMAVVESVGCSFAFPTTTVHVAGAEAAAARLTG